MARILIVDDEAIIREPIASALRGRGHEVVCASNASAAWEGIRDAPPDLVLLDIRMPQIDGLTFLRKLRSTPPTSRVPVLLLSSMSGRDLILAAAKLGAQGFLLKSRFSLQLLFERIDTLVGTANDNRASPSGSDTNEIADDTPPMQKLSQVSTRFSEAGQQQAPKKVPPELSAWPRLLSRDATLARVDQVASGKALAGVVARLVSVANSPHADLSDVVHVIESDPVLAARVLQLANSASVASRGRVRTVDDAARNVGVRGIQNMAISLGIVGAFPPDDRDGFNSMRCWQHSYAVADLLTLLLRESDPSQEGLNHLVGLCHDMGDILIRQHFAAEYEVILRFATQHELPSATVQSVALGVRQPELVSRLLTRIGLPAYVVDTIRNYHEALLSPQRNLNGAARWLWVANMAAHGLLLAPTAQEVIQPISLAHWRQLEKSKEPPDIDPRSKRAELLTATHLLARLPATEEPRLTTAVIPPSSKKLKYVRPAAFCGFDPLAFALSLVAELSVSSEMPESGELDEVDGLVTVGLRAGATNVEISAIQSRIAASGKPALPVMILLPEGETCKQGSIMQTTLPLPLNKLAAWLAWT
jgi:HD-like signal output (HDOD) protein/CheY-like chemotaxis protein